MEQIERYSDILDKIRNINTDDMSYNTDSDIIINETEKQKVYFWIRLLLKEEMNDIQIGDDFEICYLATNESINTKFIAFAKKNLNRDLDNSIINYDPEDDKKILCLMVDEEHIESDSIPFIRTLFKTSKYFEYQVYRRNELVFKNTRTEQVCEYLDADF